MNRPAPVELCHKNMRFLITHNPTDSTLNSFIEVGVNSEWHKENNLVIVQTYVSVCTQMILKSVCPVHKLLVNRNFKVFDP
uniref:Uncharacterized protein n=1 Tax=Xiphophorus couchianus TaxID=32473 RepID=A0A3B5MBK4_9TELE